MEAILLALLVAVLNGAIAFIDQMLNDLIPMTLYADRYMVATSGGSMVTVLFDIMLGFGISMIVLKFLKKGFECYIMWTDGDPDMEPAGLMIRFVEAIVVAVCFSRRVDQPASYGSRCCNELQLAGVGRWNGVIGACNRYFWPDLCYLLFYSVFPVPDEGTGNHDFTDWNSVSLCRAFG